MKSEADQLRQKERVWEELGVPQGGGCEQLLPQLGAPVPVLQLWGLLVSGSLRSQLQLTCFNSGACPGADGLHPERAGGTCAHKHLRRQSPESVQCLRPLGVVNLAKENHGGGGGGEREGTRIHSGGRRTDSGW